MEKEFNLPSGNVILVKNGELFINGENQKVRGIITRKADFPAVVKKQIKCVDMELGTVESMTRSSWLILKIEVVNELLAQQEEIRKQEQAEYDAKRQEWLKTPEGQIQILEGKLYQARKRHKKWCEENEEHDFIDSPEIYEIKQKIRELRGLVTPLTPLEKALKLADSYAGASNYDKSAAGQRAKTRLLNNEDIDTVLADMEKEWSEAADRAVWNS